VLIDVEEAASKRRAGGTENGDRWISEMAVELAYL
jgi:hypothetical protein